MQQILIAAAYGEEVNTVVQASPAWVPYVVGGMAVLIVFGLVALALGVWSVKSDVKELSAKLDTHAKATVSDCNECREKVWTEIGKLRDRLTSLEAGAKNR
jgi:hypothetical protein